MQIIINEDEILEAIKGYIAKQGIVTAGREITVELTAGRGPNGSRATVEITRPDEPNNPKPAVKATEQDADTTQVEDIVDETPKIEPEAILPDPEKEEENIPEPEAEATAPTEVGGDSLFGY